MVLVLVLVLVVALDMVIGVVVVVALVMALVLVVAVVLALVLLLVLVVVVVVASHRRQGPIAVEARSHPTAKAIRSGLVAIGAASQLQLRDASVQDAECMLASSQIDVLRAASCC